MKNDKSTSMREGADSGNATSSRTAPANRSQSKRTPGPWEWRKGDEVVTAGAARETYVAWMPTSSPAGDARLIAAAPDLLNAAKDIRARHDAIAVASNFPRCGCDVCVPLRAAIQKAEAK